MLIYDGDCGFCTVSAKWAERRLPAGTPVVAWQQLDDLAERGLSVDDVTSAAYWVDREGRNHRGEQGVAAALVAIGGGWAVVGRVMAAPPVRWLAAPVYRLVARYRHRLPGGTAACRLPRG